MTWLRDRNDLLETALGGWEVSGKMRYQSGQYLTATGTSSIGGRYALTPILDVFNVLNRVNFANPEYR